MCLVALFQKLNGMKLRNVSLIALFLLNKAVRWATILFFTFMHAAVGLLLGAGPHVWYCGFLYSSRGLPAGARPAVWSPDGSRDIDPT